MAGMLANFVSEQTNAPGTNLNVVLAGANIDRIPWSQVYANGSPVFYFLDDGGEAEWGVGTFHSGTPNFISRDNVIGNTAGNTNRLNFTGAAQIYNEIPGERLPYINGQIAFFPSSHVDSHAGGVPIGAAMDFYGGVLPAGWLWANGQTLSRTTYGLLFSVIGTTYNQPSTDASSFCVPNRCEQFSVGRAFMGGAAGNNRAAGIANIGTLGAWVGDYLLANHTHTLTWSDPGHNHVVADPGHNHVVSDPGHSHTYQQTSFPGGSQLQVGSGVNISTGTGTTSTIGTGVGIFGNTTGISVFGNTTGIVASIQNTGGGVGLNFPSAIVCNVIIYAGPVP